MWHRRAIPPRPDSDKSRHSRRLLFRAKRSGARAIRILWRRSPGFDSGAEPRNRLPQLVVGDLREARGEARRSGGIRFSS
jgi:hypothetical protein